MGISKTTTGYIDGFACDANDWTGFWSGFWDCGSTSEAGCYDTAVKHEGAASTRFLYSSYSETSYWRVAFWRYVNCGPVGGGARIRMWNKHWFDPAKPIGYYVENAFYLGDICPLYYPEDPGIRQEEVYTIAGTEDWAWKKHTVIVGGNRYLTLLTHVKSIFSIKNWVDHVVICASTILTVTGLVPGQKIQLYRSSDNTKIGEQTCAGGEDHVHFDVDAEDFPEQMYMKVYATDGSTLIETTSSYEMCGGDTWNWTMGAGTLTVTSDAFIIYRSAAAGTPKTANITANLKTPAGENYPNALIQFSTSLGVVNPSSDTSDSNGNAHTALTSADHGIAVVKAQWLGDANVPPCSAYCVVHVFYEAEAPDSSKGFQFYVQGIEYPYSSGSYGFNEEGQPEMFEVETPQWDTQLTPNELVSIYRKGINEFAGVLKIVERSLSDAPRVTLRGPDISRLLNDRAVNIEIYAAKTPQYIIADLLSKYPCGITAGTLGSCPDTLTVTVDTESLFATFQRICDAVFWHFRVNPDRTIDFAESFGGASSAATFTEAVNILSPTTRTIDYTAVANRVRMRGGEALRSMKEDGTMIGAQGLLEAPAFQSTITDQSTLDTACQALLDLLKTQLETITMDAVDDFPVGTFGPEDRVTIESPSLGLSGWYTVKRIERDMTDADFIHMDLSNRSKEYWALDEAYRRMTKDASV